MYIYIYIYTYTGCVKTPCTIITGLMHTVSSCSQHQEVVRKYTTRGSSWKLQMDVWFSFGSWGRTCMFLGGRNSWEGGGLTFWKDYHAENCFLIHIFWFQFYLMLWVVNYLEALPSRGCTKPLSQVQGVQSHSLPCTGCIKLCHKCHWQVPRSGLSAFAHHYS